MTPTGDILEIHEKDTGELAEDKVAPEAAPIAPAPADFVAPYAVDNHQAQDGLDNEIPTKWMTASTHRRISSAIGMAPNVVRGQCGHT